MRGPCITQLVGFTASIKLLTGRSSYAIKANDLGRRVNLWPLFERNGRISRTMLNSDVHLTALYSSIRTGLMRVLLTDRPDLNICLYLPMCSRKIFTLYYRELGRNNSKQQRNTLKRVWIKNGWSTIVGENLVASCRALEEAKRSAESILPEEIKSATHF